MRCVNFGYVTVRKSAAGGAFAVVGNGFFSFGTGFGGVTVRLFFTVDPAGHGLCPLMLGWHLRVRLLPCSCRVSRVQRCVATVAGGPGVCGCLICLSVRLSCSLFVVCLVPYVVLAMAILGGVQVRGSHLAAMSI